MKFSKCICGLFLVSLFSGSYSYGASVHKAGLYLIILTADKHDQWSKACHGLLVTGRHIATSTDCAKEVTKRQAEGSVRVLREMKQYLTLENNLDNDEFFAISRLGSNMLLPVEGGKAFNSTVNFAVNHDETVDSGLVYYLDDAADLINESISLERPKAEDSANNYRAISETQLPLGSPVLSEEGEIICFITASNECQVPDFNFGISSAPSDLALQKRTNDEACQVKFFQCSNASFSTCLSNGNGEGTCTNDKTGETCGVATYQNGFNATTATGVSLYCNNPDGCEAVICPSTCVSNSSSCTCRATYKLNNLTNKLPCDCIDYTDTSITCDANNGGGSFDGLSTGWKYGIAIGAPTLCVFIVAAAVFIIYYARLNQQAGNSRQALQRQT